MVYCAGEELIMACRIKPGDNRMTVGRIVPVLCVTGALLMGIPWTVMAGNQAESSAADRMVRDTKEAMEATRQYTIQQKEAFQKVIQAELKEMQVKITELQKKTSVASVKARDEMQKAIQDLEEKKKEANKKLEEVNASTTSAWSKLKDGMATAVEDLKKSYKEALSKLP
ncbi:MAG: uncharacterized protein K0S45_1419 [Nitrospira sp.]|nr:uncharacterized protein [Nitrospira sp.]